MKALNFYAKRDIRFEEVAEPVIEKNNEVKIKIKATGICVRIFTVMRGLVRMWQVLYGVMNAPVKWWKSALL